MNESNGVPLDDAAVSPPATIRMRAFCENCGGQSGTVTDRNGQNVVNCAGCGRYQYCAPKRETGQRPMNLQERIGVKPSVRARILRDWDHRCAYCGTDAFQTNGGLHLAHLIDRQDAHRYGLLDELIDDPVNLVPACAACNLGERTLGPKQLRLIVRFLVISHRKAREELDAA